MEGCNCLISSSCLHGQSKHKVALLAPRSCWLIMNFSCPLIVASSTSSHAHLSAQLSPLVHAFSACHPY